MKKFLSRLKQLKPISEEVPWNPKVAIAGVAMLGAIYLFSKSQDSAVTHIYEAPAGGSTDSRIISNSASVYKRKSEALGSQLGDLQKQIDALRKELKDQRTTEDTVVKEPEDKPVLTSAPEPDPLSNMAVSPPPREFRMETINDGKSLGLPTHRKPRVTEAPAVLSFPVKAKQQKAADGVVIPSGSFVKARLLTGVEAAEGKALPVLMQADFAFVGPNKTRIDLSGCFIIAKSTGNLSIERVEMQATKISCVSPSGKMFERSLSGFVADNEDNSFAVMGPVNSKQDRVASMAFLASVVEGIGSAISQAQTSTNTGALGNSTTTISGDKQRYIGATGASKAASSVASWYLNHAQSLLPTINIGSGKAVWVVSQETVALPNWFFSQQHSQTHHTDFVDSIIP